MSLAFDSCDKEIIDILQSDSSISNIELSKKIGLSPSACLSRTKRLKELGVIKQFATIIDEKKVGLEIVAFTFVNLSPHNRKTANAFLLKVKETPKILECYNVTGSWDYLLKIVSHDIASYRDFIMDSLLEFPGVNKIDTNIVLGTDKQSFCLPIDQV
ncbi:MAG: Lrp/AsnC family transcriptional regulator [Desulfitobacteriaceae bacterium]|nr:Lrp/AsnC family transcriptional regulator [Desulfitobacteriaceae bacterium]MDI6878596.1 Lrp/AsnC family transcriptional regulator [Desulfitobacteriaceae bacterium]MDI6913674.1 Lrp/AsnC family transcriptional regulator [Desulfitobacteriaceae bacterium]